MSTSFEQGDAELWIALADSSGFKEDGGNLANFDQKNNSIVVPDNLASYLTSQNLQASNLGFQQSFNACSSTTRRCPAATTLRRVRIICPIVAQHV